MIDRKQIWRPLKNEITSLPYSTKKVDGKVYADILLYFKEKILAAAKSRNYFNIGNSPLLKVSNIDEFRLLYPLDLSHYHGERPKKIGNTVGKVIDNLMRGDPPVSGAVTGSTIPPNT